MSNFPLYFDFDKILIMLNAEKAIPCGASKHGTF